MNQLITTGIDGLVARPGPGRSWTITFGSSNVGLHHQLYLNGRLADFTDAPAQRRFVVDEPAAPALVVIAAVAEPLRALDLADQLATQQRRPSWVYRPRIPRLPPIRQGDVVALLDDHATGTLDQIPLATAELWPADQPRWAFGQDRFGQGGFGYDGANGPGFGLGAWGAGLFGVGTDLVDLEAALAESGLHAVVLRTVAADGRQADSEPVAVIVEAPPPAPARLTAVAYDSQTQQLTLQIS